MSIDLSLDRIRQLFDHLPPYTRPTCHIAGTNGKGSVSALLSSILAASSYSVGRYNSPHLVSIYDCITLNNEPVSPVVYESARKRVEDADREHGTGCSNFELLTTTALLIFEEAQLDVVVLEVGMGGRLDATNIIADACVLVSVLTAVDLDHTAFLGTTVREIAREKAAIARPGKPFVLGPQNPTHAADVEDVVREVVNSVRGELVLAFLPTKRDWISSAGGRTPVPRSLSPSTLADSDGPPPFAQPVSFALPGLPSGPDIVHTLLPLQGEHQLANLGTTVSVISKLIESEHPTLDFKNRITTNTVSHGVQATRWPGRLSFHSIALPLPCPESSMHSGSEASQSSRRSFLALADGAHNPASSATLSAFVNKILRAVSQAPDGSISATLAVPAPGESPQTASPPPQRTISLTYLLALSHSPPKTPAQTLMPLLEIDTDALDTHVRLVTRVGLLQFTPPQGMPWVKSEPPEEVRNVVRSLLPSAEVWTPRHEDSERLGEPQLRAALNWAAERHLHDHGGDSDGEGLIIIAGSLYLVADFYRLLQAQK